MATPSLPVAHPRTKREKTNFHLIAGLACLFLLLISIVGCRLTSIHIGLSDIGNRPVALLVLTAIILPLPAYWHEKQRPTFRDSSLTLPWIFLIAFLFEFPFLIAARLRMPLADPLLARIDNAMRISVPVIRSWASYHRIGAGLNVSYALLMPLLVLAIFAPALAGKVQPAREFVIANLIAIAIGAPLFALLPAVGPWYSYHFAPTSDQALCQIQLLAARTPGPYIYTSAPAHIVSFPSFHVLWAILCARALWGFRYFRLPLALLSGMIIVSTMTTGWHYATDVIGGLILAAISISIAYRIT